MTAVPGGHIYLFGEVLFDHFPDGSRVLGGAPFNVAWHLQAFGQAPRLISRIGSDTEGQQVLDAMRSWGMNTDYIQVDPRRPTGRVAVSFSNGEPSYEIVTDCAYDAIEPVTPESCRLLYHGSLAARAAASAAALRHLRDSASGSVFIDVNLRSPWWQADSLRTSLAGADWVKLNHEELALLGQPDAEGDPGQLFMQRYGLRGLLVTYGARGAELLLAAGERLEVAPQPDIEVVDTVGAGDAFAAVLLLGLSSDWPLPLTLQRAQEFAAAVVGCRGATIADPDFYRAFSHRWHTAD
jgi:fructokinase